MFLSTGLCSIHNDVTSYDHAELYGSLLISSETETIVFAV